MTQWISVKEQLPDREGLYRVSQIISGKKEIHFQYFYPQKLEYIESWKKHFLEWDGPYNHEYPITIHENGKSKIITPIPKPPT